MNRYIKQLNKGVFLLALIAGMTSCELEQITNPNSPGTDIVASPAFSDLQNLVSGAESGMRNRLGTYYDGVGVIGRDFWRFSASDPRFTNDLLGQGTSVLDNNTFYTTGPYAERYRVVKNMNLLLEGIENTTASITTDTKNNFIAFAKTIKAYQLLMVLNQQDANGIRTDVADPDNLGAFESKTAALTTIKGLLDEAGNVLAGRTGALGFDLSQGFDGFNTVEGFYQFNRGLAARVAAYQGNYAEVLTALDDSFLSLDGTALNTGVFHYYSIAGGDVTNPLFLVLDGNGEIRLAHPDFVADAEAGDNRLSKIVQRSSTTTLGTSELSGDYDFALYTTNVDFIPIIRNEELILLYAEAKIQTNVPGDAITALNIIRNAAGLANYSGATDTNTLTNEMLRQRRYSLYGEGHRWIDMRRYNKLDELTIDRTDDDVWELFPRPASEG